MRARLQLQVSTVCLALLCAMGAAAQEGTFAPPGTLYAIADTSLHLHCTGAGAPTILLDAGLAGNYLDWSLVQPLVALRYRVCAFDRAGAGFSARTERPRDAVHMTQELHLVIAAAQLQTPLILVGHSFGGLLALAHAQTWPADIAGLVLLDPVHPQQFRRFAAAGVDLPTEPLLVLGRTGGLAALYGLPEALYPLALSLAGETRARVFIVREMRGMAALADWVDARPLPRLPTRILLHGNREWDGPYPDGRMENLWTVMQGELAASLGAPGPLIIARSGHQLALDAPQAVADAIAALAVSLAKPDIKSDIKPDIKSDMDK